MTAGMVCNADVHGTVTVTTAEPPFSTQTLPEPWKLACGIPHEAGSGVPAEISAGIALLEKNQILI
jgi:hypothetical protein